MIVRPCGDLALLVDLDDVDEVLSLAGELRRDPPEGVVDVVPAARTVLLALREGADPSAIRDEVMRRGPRLTSESQPTGTVVEIEVVYDGPDLADVATLTGLSADEVVRAHTGRDWRAAFIGFAPGFAYLDDGDERLAVPRRAEPRTRVPAGSVALAGGLSAVYPRESPGGWQLIGRTDASLWDLDRDPPALIRPGDAVRFRSAGS